VLGGLVWVGYLYNLGQKQLRQLEEMRDGRLAGAANRMLFQITYSATAWMLNMSPETRERMDSIRKWAGLELKRLEDTETELVDVQAFVDNNLEKTTPEELLEKLYKADEDVKQLAPDYLRQPFEKLQKLHARTSVQFENLLAKNVIKTRRILRDVEKPASLLDFTKPVSDVSHHLATVQAGLQQIAPLEHPTIPALRFPVEINATIGDLRTKTDLFAAELSSLTAARQAMIQAQQLSGYQGALSTYSKLRFTECLIAASMIGTFPTEDMMVARLLFGGDVNAWRVARQQAADGYTFTAAKLTDDERQKLAALRDDPNLNTAGAAKKVLDAKHLRTAIDTTNSTLTTSLIELVDRVIRAPEGDSLAKAYLVGELASLIQARNVDWGLHYCPELTTCVSALETIRGTSALSSGDWKKPTLRKQLQSKLAAFFETVALGRPFIELASARRDQAAAIASQGVRYAGFLDDALSLHALPQKEPSFLVWGVASDGQTPSVVHCAAGSARSQDLTSLHPWSPLFCIPMAPAHTDEGSPQRQGQAD